MKCPHCQVHIHPNFHKTNLNDGLPLGLEFKSDTYWRTSQMACPSCYKAIIFLSKNIGGVQRWNDTLVHPIAANRPPAPVEVPNNLADDYNEACSVLSLSPKASAALSRRCLQHLLNLQGFTQRDLSKAIDDAIKNLPINLANNLDAVRNIGNFAAHPLKDKNFGEIVDVEPEEAEWNLEVLEGLFDYFYVQPTKDQARRDALNEKLIAAGKPPMKSP